MPTSPRVRLGGFRSELHGSFTRRADALFELGDALLSSQTPFLSLPHLSLEPTHRRGWGSAYAALASGRIEVERLRDLLVSHLPPADPPVLTTGVRVARGRGRAPLPGPDPPGWSRFFP